MLDLNPELFSEAVAKGVGDLERGVTEYSAWSRLLNKCVEPGPILK